MKTRSAGHTEADGIIETLKSEIPGVLLITIVELGAHQDRKIRMFNKTNALNVPGARAMKVFSASRAILEALEIRDDQVEETVSIAGNRVHILKPVLQGTCVLSLILDSEICNLAWALQALSTHT
jgi:hypothetical protein